MKWYEDRLKELESHRVLIESRCKELDINPLREDDLLRRYEMEIELLKRAMEDRFGKK